MTDTAAAIASIKIAKGYYERLSEKNLTYSEQLDCLKFGAHHLSLARAADPAAVLTIDTPKGCETWTQEILSASFLYIQATIEAAREDDEGYKKAFETLKQASVYAPNLPYIHRKIAEVLLKLHRRDEALTAAKFALALNPDDMQSRLLADKIDTTPTLGVEDKSLPGDPERRLGTGIMIAAPIWFMTVPPMMEKSGASQFAVSVAILASFLIFYIGFKIRQGGNATDYIHKHAQKDHYK